MEELQVEQIDFTSDEYKIFKEHLNILVQSQSAKDKSEIEHLSLKIKIGHYLERKIVKEKSVGAFILGF